MVWVPVSRRWKRGSAEQVRGPSTSRSSPSGWCVSDSPLWPRTNAFGAEVLELWLHRVCLQLCHWVCGWIREAFSECDCGDVQGKRGSARFYFGEGDGWRPWSASCSSSP